MRLIDGDKLSQEIEYMYLGSDTKENHRVCAETEDTMIGKFQVIDTIFEMPTVFEIPDNATNGDIIKALFPNPTENSQYTVGEDGVYSTPNGEMHYYSISKSMQFICSTDYWNTPYKVSEFKNEKQKMKKLDVWVTSPQSIANYAHNSRYAFAVCQCPVSFDKGIVIDTWQTKKIHGAYRFHCTECGLHGEIFA